MDANTSKLLDIKLNKVKDALIANNMDARILENAEAVRNEIASIIEKGSSVNLGGSQTLFECGVIDLLREMDINLKDRYAPNLSREQLENIYREAFFDDYYVSSSNAITMQGELYNVDGRSNRVAAMSYGPKHVILVVGYNKIVDDMEAAIKRVESVAAPANCIRLNRNTPCAISGKCMHCKSDATICCTYVVHRKQMVKNRIIVLLVKEEYGY